ncbi:MAG TPA: hypothetical protein EYP36_02770 [Calditrichaeota bacterium]|nr:hypothetical protein [Calditrichota bacterium]
MPEALSFNRELKRKSIHLATSAIPVAYYFWLTREQILFLSVFLTIGFFTADILRMKFALAEKYFIRIFSPLLRKSEVRRRFTGASFLFLGITITVAAFTREIAIPAILLVTIADSMAALVGKWYGRHKLFNKTVEGTLSFTAISFLLVAYFWGWSLLVLLIAIPIALVELLGEKVNDNLTIPVISALLMQAVYL